MVRSQLLDSSKMTYNKSTDHQKRQAITWSDYWNDPTARATVWLSHFHRVIEFTKICWFLLWKFFHFERSSYRWIVLFQQYKYIFGDLRWGVHALFHIYHMTSLTYDAREARDVSLTCKCHLSDSQIVSSVKNMLERISYLWLCERLCICCRFCYVF